METTIDKGSGQDRAGLITETRNPARRQVKIWKLVKRSATANAIRDSVVMCPDLLRGPGFWTSS